MSIRKLLDEKLEEGFLVFTMVLMVILIFSQVISRYIIGSSLSWSEELARYIHIWQVWIGASYAVRKSAHIKVEAFKKIFNEKIQKIIDLFALLAWFGLSLFLAIQGTQMVMKMLERGQTSPAMEIPMWILFSAIPLGGLLMSIRLIQQVIWLFQGPKSSPDVTDSKSA
ncbi:TRAP transporter small permease [Ammoniphilus sp. YIM 78166]|uniref:TRAP transporter small permease n=1 Tax=Ammoniphilus sp. YIM 78166 TaxID=1644106 RepID=UPI00106F4D98|nr:TRAP transporter small permease [Ammoniphilus sp. YIM 78166]